MHRIRKSFTFEAAHQLEGAFTAACHECIHGHSYTVELFLESKGLDDNQMVLDFGELKGFKDKVMETWDHGLLLHHDKRKYFEPLIDAGVLKASKVHFFALNPTAEAMAECLYEQLLIFVERLVEEKARKISRENDYSLAEARQSLPKVKVRKVRVHETSTGWAEYRGVNAK